MRCPSCGSELSPPFRFCSGCGSRVMERMENHVIETVITVEDDSFQEIPEDLRTDLEKLHALIQSPNGKDYKSSGKQMYVATRSGDIDISCDLSELDDINLFTTGNVRISHSDVFHKAIFSYSPVASEERILCREIGFKEFLIIRREVDEFDENHIVIYTDYCTKSIGYPILGNTEMRFVSRKPIFILYRKNRFYVYCSNPAQDYIRIDGSGIPNSRIKVVSMGTDVTISGVYGLKLCLQ